MNTFKAAPKLMTIFAAALVCACQATTPTPTDAPNKPTSTATNIASPASVPTAAAAPTASPAPTATTVAPSPTAAATPLDGSYRTSFTEAELEASPLLYDRSELNDGNWGDWTMTFGNGLVSYTQTNASAHGASSGTFTVAGDAVTMAFTHGANAGETFGLRWTLIGDNLSFTRDETLGPGPTPFLVNSWTRIGSSGGTALPETGANLFPGTWRTALQPPVTLTIGHQVDLDCVPGYRCRGDIDANFPFWLDLEFGNRHGAELMVIGLTNSAFAATDGAPLDSPEHYADWVERQPDVSVLHKALETSPRLSWTRLDIETGKQDLVFGLTGLAEPPRLSLGPATKARITIVGASDNLFLILEMSGPENTVGDFDAAIEALQPVIDSMVWPAMTATNERIVINHDTTTDEGAAFTMQAAVATRDRRRGRQRTQHVPS